MTPRKVINDRYELRRSPIARGGMGEVWEGRDTKLDREVAVKFVRFPDGLPDEELVRRFVRESRITARLQHPGVPAVFDVGTEDGRPFLVMQRIRGISISDLLAQHERLPIGWAAAIAAQTCAVLAVAHQASLIHRDLKPANLMLEADGTVKVLDFGLAGALDLADMSRITRSGQNVGTPAYMAPEQVLAAMSSPRTDLYALGCTLHEMLTGRQLFTGPTPYSVMSKQVDENPPPPRNVRSDVPTDLDALILALLEKKPEDRPESALATYERLLPFATDLGALPGVLHPPSIPSPVRMYAEVVSRTYRSKAEPAAAKPMAERGVARETVDVPILPPDKPAHAGATRQRIETARNQATSLVRQARYSEAAELLGSVARTAGAVFGPVDAEVVELRMDWAHVLFEGGDYRAAAPAYQALKADLIERDGPDTDLVFRCRLQYATCHALLGDAAVALAEMQSLAADEERVFGQDDPRLVELRRQIGLLQLGAGQRQEAESTLRMLRDDLVRAHGARHAMVSKIDELLGSLPGGEQ